MGFVKLKSSVVLKELIDGGDDGGGRWRREVVVVDSGLGFYATYYSFGGTG